MSTDSVAMGETARVAAGANGVAAGLMLHEIEHTWGRERVLRGVSLSVESGCVAWLGGENGAGKTTLLRIAAGLILPRRGLVRLCGMDPDHDRRDYQRRLGYLSAGDRGLYARLTVRQSLEFWSGIALVPPRRRKQLIASAIARFDLEELSSRRVDRLSTGQRQRVRLSMTFLHEPDVALLDEPNASLDDTALALLDGALSELTARGGSALWCSPASRHLSVRADTRLLLVDGRVIAE